MAAIGVGFLSAIIGKVVSIGFNYMADQLQQQTSLENELHKLHLSLPRIQAVVHAAGRGHLQIEEGPLKDWWWLFKGTLDAAEDVLDDFDYLQLEEQAQQQQQQEEEADDDDDQGEQEVQLHKVRKVLNTISLSKRQHSVIGTRDRRLGPILKRLREVVKAMDVVCVDLGLFASLVSSEQQRQLQEHEEFVSSRETGPFLAEHKVLGRDDEREKVLSWLLNTTTTTTSSSRDDLSLLSLVGHGGMGKSTLAQLVYNDASTERSFDLRMWVCVSNRFDVKGIARSMLESANNVRCRLISPNTIWDAVKEKLMASKRFLLVLDDVWNDDNLRDWEKLFALLSCGRKGSKIMLTTRMGEVAQLAATALYGAAVEEYSVFSLNGLRKQDCLSLFNRHAFAGVNPDDYQNLQSIGEAIVERLGGSPLAAKVAGGMLNSSLDEEHWEDILDHGVSEDIMAVLTLSYHHLPENLRPCFTYCSIFSRDHQFDKDDLVHRWVALGLIQQQSQNQKSSLEDIGGSYFDYLVKRSFIEPHLLISGRFIMHDMLSDLAEWASSGEILRLVGGDSVTTVSIPGTIRHLSVSGFDLDMNMVKMAEDCKNLRSLHLLCYDYGPEEADALQMLLLSSKSLRLLQLDVNYGSNTEVPVLPDAIGELRHLRYLKLSPGYRQFPSSFCKLYHLQVISLDPGQDPSVFTQSMNSFTSLRHLIPLNVFSNVAGIGRLTSLQELCFIVREEAGYKIEELKNMNELRELVIEGLDNVKSEEEASMAELPSKEQIRTLELKWGLNMSYGPELDEQVLDCLRPHSSLKKLTITEYRGTKTASWMQPHSTKNLTYAELEYLKLENCSGWEHLDHLGRLPCLRYLTLKNMPAVKKVSCEGGFPQLEVVDICKLGEWEEWSQLEEDKDVGQWCPYLLRSLKIVDCPKLKVLPSLPHGLNLLAVSNVGLSILPTLWHVSDSNNNICTTSRSSSLSSSLSRIMIDNCPKLASLADSFLQHDLEALEYLYVSDCEELADLPARGFRHYCSMKILRLENCPKLQLHTAQCSNTPEGGNLLPSSIQELYIATRSELDLVVLLQGSLPSLSVLELKYCYESSLPPEIVWGRMISLRDLTIKNSKTLTSMEGLKALRHLDRFSISRCPKLTHGEADAGVIMEEDITLTIDCLEIDDPFLLLVQPLRYITSVRKLTISYGYKLKSKFDKVEPWLLQNRSSLEELSLHNLVTLQLLPASFQHLSSLKLLYVTEAHKLRSLPQLPASLETLRIKGCPWTLMQRCHKDEGADWHNIAHIPKLELDY